MSVVLQCGVVWCGCGVGVGVVWCGVVWCGVVLDNVGRGVVGESWSGGERDEVPEATLEPGLVRPEAKAVRLVKARRYGSSF